MFHQNHGMGVILTNGQKTATYNGGLVQQAGPEGARILDVHGVVVSQKPLTEGQSFDIRVDETRGPEKQILTLGVTQGDTNTAPDVKERAKEMENATVVEGKYLIKEGKQEPRAVPLHVTHEDTLSLLWEGEDIYISHNGNRIGAITVEKRHIWAVTEVWPGLPKLSIISPGPGTQSLGASSITCPLWQVCRCYIDLLKLHDVYFVSQYDTCYCTNCIGPNLYCTRGEPPKVYSMPKGWCRFGLRVSPAAYGMDTFNKWHVAYHGTTPGNIQKILESGLLMPGDYPPEGGQISPPSGHFTETRKPGGFDIKQLFLSPTIAYAGHDAYARPYSWTNPKTGITYTIQVALQVRIKPNSYEVGKETVGLGCNIIDEHFKNSELEWSTKRRGVIYVYGILVKCLPA